MRNLIVFLVVSSLFLSTCIERIDTEIEKEAIQAVLDHYHKALGNEDMEMISKLYAHDNDIIQFNDVGTWTGWNEIEPGFQKWFDESENIKFNFRNEIIKVHDSGKAAWISFIQDGSIIFKNQPESFKDARVTWGLEKRNGKWVIVQAHFSAISEESLVA